MLWPIGILRKGATLLWVGAIPWLSYSRVDELNTTVSDQQYEIRQLRLLQKMVEKGKRCRSVLLLST